VSALDVSGTGAFAPEAPALSGVVGAPDAAVTVRVESTARESEDRALTPVPHAARVSRSSDVLRIVSEEDVVGRTVAPRREM